MAKNVDTNNTASSGADSDDTTTLVPDEQTSETQVEWLSTINSLFSARPVFSLDNLLLYIINQASYLHFSGNLSHQDKYEEFKQLVGAYQSQADFNAKFACLKKILVCLPTLLANRCRLIYLEVGKKGLWSELVSASESLSSLYMLTLVQFYMVNWRLLKIIACEDCKKKGGRFEKLDSLAEVGEYLKDQEEGLRGFLLCIRCDVTSKTRAVHRQCLASREEREMGAYRCESCIQVGWYLWECRAL